MSDREEGSPIRRERNPYERHLAAQPYLADYIPTTGAVPDDAVGHFMRALEDWLEEEAKLRKEASLVSPQRFIQCPKCSRRPGNDPTATCGADDCPMHLQPPPHPDPT